MIYLEILELNFCGLNDGLKEIIKVRSEKEKEIWIFHLQINDNYYK